MIDKIFDHLKITVNILIYNINFQININMKVFRVYWFKDQIH